MSPRSTATPSWSNVISIPVSIGTSVVSFRGSVPTTRGGPATWKAQPVSAAPAGSTRVKRYEEPGSSVAAGFRIAVRPSGAAISRYARAGTTRRRSRSEASGTSPVAARRNPAAGSIAYGLPATATSVAPISGAAGRASFAQAAAAGVGAGDGGVVSSGTGDVDGWTGLGAVVGTAGLADGGVGEQAASTAARATTSRRAGVVPRGWRTGPARPAMTRSGRSMQPPARRCGGAPRDASWTGCRVFAEPRARPSTHRRP